MVSSCLKKSGEEKDVCIFLCIHVFVCVFVCMICVSMCVAFEKWNVKNKISSNNEKQNTINNKNQV